MLVGMTFNQLWTKPYYGVSHLKQPSRRYQFTVNEYKIGSAYGYMLDFDSDRAFTAAKEVWAVNAASARGTLEAWARELDLIR
jgi:hypothetical protein